MNFISIFFVLSALWEHSRTWATQIVASECDASVCFDRCPSQIFSYRCDEDKNTICNCKENNCDKEACRAKCRGEGKYRCVDGQMTCDCFTNFCDGSACKQQCPGVDYSFICDASGSTTCTCAKSNCDKAACKAKCNGSYKWGCQRGVDSCQCFQPKTCDVSVCREKCSRIGFNYTCNNGVINCQCNPDNCNKAACVAKCNGAFKWRCNMGVEDCQCIDTESETYTSGCKKNCQNFDCPTSAEPTCIDNVCRCTMRQKPVKVVEVPLDFQQGTVNDCVSNLCDALRLRIANNEYPGGIVTLGNNQKCRCSIL